MIGNSQKQLKMMEKIEEQFTKYEIARILGARALQLAMDAPVLLKIDKEKLEEINYDVLKIAELEFENGVLPITVKRPFPEKSDEKTKKIGKDEAEAIEKKEEAKIQEEKREEAEDRKIEEKEMEEEKEIKEEGEIMALATPEDEVEGENGDNSEEGV